jgi:protoheme IX farnesyltransferase
MRNHIKNYMELAKVRITFAVTLTTFVGYFMVDGVVDNTLWWTLLGIFLLASGSAALNQYQEYHLDAKMDRTKNRPIPSGNVSPLQALLFAFLLSAGGSYLLYWSTGFESMQLGILALIWYNAVYTPLKRKTAFAVVPGSVIGAIPPMVGYVAAGGSLNDPQILAFAFFMFMWQVPHFWLLVMKNGADYRKAGFPTIADVYSEKQLKSITYVWIVATAVSSMLLPLMHVLKGQIFLILLSVSFVAVLIGFSSIFKRAYNKKTIFSYFMGINVYLLVILGLIVAGVS